MNNYIRGKAMTLDELREKIGQDLSGFLSVYGGQRIYIPKKASRKHRLSGVVGIDAMERLCSAYGGESVNMPTQFRIRTEQREDQIMNMKLSGVSINRIAGDLMISRRTVERILSKRRDEVVSA